MRLDRSGFCVSLAIDNTHFERSAQGLDQNVGDLGFHRDLWAWPRHLAQRGKDRLRIGFGPQRITWRERSEETTSELQSLMRISYAVFCLNTIIIHSILVT